MKRIWNLIDDSGLIFVDAHVPEDGGHHERVLRRRLVADVAVPFDLHFRFFLIVAQFERNPMIVFLTQLVNCSVALLGGHGPHQVVDKLLHLLDVLQMELKTRLIKQQEQQNNISI